MTTRLTTRRNLKAVVAAAFVALALSTTACSGSDTGKPKNADVNGAATQADQAYEHRKCLREHGLAIPEPKPGEGITLGDQGMSKEELEKAFKACQDKAVGGPGKEMSQADRDKMLAYARCMRENGFNMPDPTFDGGAGAALPVPEGVEKQKFDKANKACEGAGR
jgi:hypothetical protein